MTQFSIIVIDKAYATLPINRTSKTKKKSICIISQLLQITFDIRALIGWAAIDLHPPHHHRRGGPTLSAKSSNWADINETVCAAPHRETNHPNKLILDGLDILRPRDSMEYSDRQKKQQWQSFPLRYALTARGRRSVSVCSTDQMCARWRQCQWNQNRTTLKSSIRTITSIFTPIKVNLRAHRARARQWGDANCGDWCEMHQIKE